MITVTKPYLPPIEEFQEYLKEIWENGILTNNGPFHGRLEEALCEYLGVKYISLFSNGTLALITALQALKISGEVITTPFSFVATTHALWWNNITPVFVDIEPDFYNIDPKKIEAAITPRTTAIVPVHVYGNPAQVEEIDRIAKVYGIKVIYDAAHAFGTQYKNTSILNWGDLSVLSFHATKVFNTLEGGAIVCHDLETKKRIDRLKNFGFENEVTVTSPGINAKLNEIQSAFGLIQLKYVDSAIAKREAIHRRYEHLLSSVCGISMIGEAKHVKVPYSYFPIVIDRDEYGITRDGLYDALKEAGIYCRRYFYPLISQFPTYQALQSSSVSNLPVATRIAEGILCLPIYPLLEMDDVDRICSLIQSLGKKKSI